MSEHFSDQNYFKNADFFFFFNYNDSISESPCSLDFLFTFVINLILIELKIEILTEYEKSQISIIFKPCLKRGNIPTTSILAIF